MGYDQLTAGSCSFFHYGLGHIEAYEDFGNIGIRHSYLQPGIIKTILITQRGIAFQCIYDGS